MELRRLGAGSAPALVILALLGSGQAQAAEPCTSGELPAAMKKSIDTERQQLIAHFLDLEPGQSLRLAFLNVKLAEIELNAAEAEQCSKQRDDRAQRQQDLQAFAAHPEIVDPMEAASQSDEALAALGKRLARAQAARSANLALYRQLRQALATWPAEPASEEAHLIALRLARGAEVPDADICPAGDPALATKRYVESKYASLLAKATLTADETLRKAQLNRYLTQAEWEIREREVCHMQQKVEAAASAAAKSPLDAHAAGDALKFDLDLEFITTRRDLAKSAAVSAVDQFRQLQIKQNELAGTPTGAERERLQKDADRLAALIPTIPMPVAEDEIKLGTSEVYKAVRDSGELTAKVEARAKDARSYADDTATLALAHKRDDATDKATRAETAARARRADDDARKAQGYAQDAQAAGNSAVALALRAQSWNDPSLEAQDLASANVMVTQAKSSADWTQYARSEALLNKLRVTASVEQIMAVGQERDQYVEFMTVMADNPDAKALLGSPGVSLTAESGNSAATLKLSMDRLFGATQRTLDLTLTAPTSPKSPDRTSLWNHLDGLAGGFSAQLTHTSYWLLEQDRRTHYFGLFGVGGRVGRETHTYVDESDLSATHDTGRRPASALVYAGLAPVSMKWLVLGKFEYQKAYEDGTPTTECPAPTGSGSLIIKCVSGPLGLPDSTHKRLWSLELRKAWNSFAVGALLSHDAAAHKSGLDLPLYFLSAPAKDGSLPALTGGINLSWDSVKHGSVGLFIGSPFQVKDF